MTLMHAGYLCSVERLAEIQAELHRCLLGDCRRPQRVDAGREDQSIWCIKWDNLWRVWVGTCCQSSWYAIACEHSECLLLGGPPFRIRVGRGLCNFESECRLTCIFHSCRRLALRKISWREGASGISTCEISQLHVQVEPVSRHSRTLGSSGKICSDCRRTRYVADRILHPLVPNKIILQTWLGHISDICIPFSTHLMNWFDLLLFITVFVLSFSTLVVYISGAVTRKSTIHTRFS